MDQVGFSGKEAADSWEFSGTCDDPARLRGRCIGHRITIDAPPELVWDFVSDFQGWSSWSPLYSETAGTVEEGETLRFGVHLARTKPRKAKAVVRKVEPNELLEYAVSSMGGLVKLYRTIGIEELSPVRCRVANSQIVGGLLGARVFRGVGAKSGDRLKMMNQALKRVAERKWRDWPGR